MKVTLTPHGWNPETYTGISEFGFSDVVRQSIVDVADTVLFVHRESFRMVLLEPESEVEA